MGIRGAVSLGFFGALFAALTMHWHWHQSGLPLALPLLVFVLIGAVGFRVSRLPGDGVAPSPEVRRVIKWSTVGEGVVLCVVANAVILLNRLDLLLPAMTLVVGLHFLSIAFAASFPPFYALGAPLVLGAFVGFVLPAPTGGEVAGLVAAAGLWTAAILALRRDLLARRSGTVAA